MSYFVILTLFLFSPEHRVKIRQDAITEFPSKYTDTVDYIIITTDELKPAFEPLYNWKRAKGVSCVIRTVEWIDNNYLGSDSPERIRNFLRNAYYEWGTKYVLLGGDVTEVPIRYVRSTDYSPYPGYYEVATDAYYSCLDGNWNANQNDVWGEVQIVQGTDTIVYSDSTDYNIHLWVGRFPVVTQQEIGAIINKTINYEKGSVGSMNYENKLLLVGGVLHNDQGEGSANCCRQIANCFPNYFRKDSLFMLHNTVSKSAILDSLKKGYPYVYVVTEGSASQSWAPPCNISRIDADTLRSTWNLMTVISCYSNWIEVDCLSKGFMLNPQGGTFAYRGSNRVGWASPETELNKAFYSKLFPDLTDDSTTEIAKLDAYAKFKITSFFASDFDEQDNHYRATFLGYTLLADPELRLWTNIPESLYVDFPGVVDVGDTEFTVSVKNFYNHQKIPYARVCISRKDELYARGFTDATGKITFVLCPEAGGILKLVVTKQGFLPYENSIFVNPTKPSVRYKSHFTDGIVEAGRKFTLHLSIENTGATKAGNVSNRLTPNSSLVTMIDSIQDYGTLYPSDTKTRSYRIIVNKASTLQQLCLFVESRFDEGSSKDTFHIEVLVPQLYHYTHSMDKDTLAPGVPISLTFKLKNSGNGKADKIKAKLISLSSEISVIDSLYEIDSIPPCKIKTFPNCFTILPTTVVQSPKFVIELEDSLSRKWADTFYIRFHEPPDSLFTLSEPHAVTVAWKPIDGLCGYNVYRAPDSALLNFSLVWDNPLFMDKEPDEFKLYSYWVTAVDSSLNESKFSSQVSGMPNPFLKDGWPRKAISRPAYFTTAAAVGNIDHSTPELEVVTNGDDGILYAWYHNGQGILSPDGMFVDNLGGCWTSPVIADVNNDGSLEIVRVQFFATDENLYVFRKDGTSLPGFPVQLQGDWGTSASPTVQDLDGDGLLEIIIMGWTSGNVYVFRADGSGFLNPNGIFAVMDTFMASFIAPAVADIDGDNTLEVVTACYASVYVWKSNGELVTNWPVEISGDPSSPAIGDIDPSYIGLEIAIHTTGNWLYVFHADGNLFWKRKCNTVKANRMSSPALGDIDGDGLLEIALTGINKLHLWNHDGTFVRNQDGVPVESLFVPMMGGLSRASTIIGDVDGDDESEIIVVSLIQGDIYAFEKDGTITMGFPIMANGLTDGTPTLADIDLDGNNELIVATATPDVRIWNVLGNKVEWGTFAHDRWHTGLYGFIPPDAVYVSETQNPSPMCFKLLQNFPNPFTKSTIINYQVPISSKVTLKVYDVTGRLVRILIDKKMSKGQHTVKWGGEDNSGKRVARGIYFYKLKTDTFESSKKIILM